MAATERQAPAESGHLIKRPRLTRMLDESDARVILLVAPAGYGKTTLAREWLEGKPHVWYRASSADADVAALAVGLASAAAEILPGADRRIRQHVRAARDPERESSVLAELVAEDLGRLPGGTWVAIDDYQYIGESAAAERFVSDLLDATSWPFLATSRTRPAWARARGVIYGGAVVLGRDELQMTDGEVEETVGRTREQVPTLFESAMGWPAIVGLAARAGPGRLEGHELPNDLYDFFAEELWQFLDEANRWFLAQIALVSPLSRRVVHELLGDETPDVLDRTARAGWLTYDGDEVVIHPLLARFLGQRFAQYPILLRREAAHRLIEKLAVEGQWDQAMALALDADESTVASVFERSIDLLLSKGRLQTIERWLAMTRDRGISSPVLDLATAEVLFRRGDYPRAEVLARNAADAAGDRSLRARSLNVAGGSARRLERLDAALALYREARNVAPDDSSLREAVIGEILSGLDLGLGDPAVLLNALPNDDRSGVDRLRRVTVEGQIALWVGNVQGALAAISALGSLVHDVDDPLARTAFFYTRSFLLTSAAHYRAALDTCAVLESEAREYRIDFALAEVVLARAGAEAGLRNFGLARRLIRERLSAVEREGDKYRIADAAAAEARIEVTAGSRVIPAFRKGLEQQACAGVYAEYVLSLALAEAAFGSPARARALKSEGMTSSLNAEAEVLAVWVDATLDPSDAELVSAAMDVTLAHGYVDRLVVAYRGTPTIAEALAADARYRSEVAEIMARANDLEIAQRLGLVSAAADAKRNRLTRREREVYALMVNGSSNRAIAQRLFITEATAKLHVRHILRKLSARSRAEAVAKWRDVLPDR